MINYKIDFTEIYIVKPKTLNGRFFLGARKAKQPNPHKAATVFLFLLLPTPQNQISRYHISPRLIQTKNQPNSTRKLAIKNSKNSQKVKTIYDPYRTLKAKIK